MFTLRLYTVKVTGYKLYKVVCFIVVFYCSCGVVQTFYSNCVRFQKLLKLERTLEGTLKQHKMVIPFCCTSLQETLKIQNRNYSIGITTHTILVSFGFPAQPQVSPIVSTRRLQTQYVPHVNIKHTTEFDNAEVAKFQNITIRQQKNQSNSIDTKKS